MYGINVGRLVVVGSAVDGADLSRKSYRVVKLGLDFALGLTGTFGVYTGYGL